MTILNDLHFAARLSLRRPAVPALVAALFALGVGLASGMWAVIDAALLRPLPFKDGDAVVFVMEDHPQRGFMAVTPANFLDWSSRIESLEAVAATNAIDASIAGAELPQRASGSRVTERFFDVLGVPPAHGRVLQADDVAAGGRVVVVSDGLWTRVFGADPNIIGAPIRIDGEAYTVVGVMPPTLRALGGEELWTPWVMSEEERGERRFHLAGVVARLRAGRTVDDAERELRSIYQELETEHPETNTNWSARVQPARDVLLGDSRSALTVLGGAVLVVVIVACINVAGLLLAWLPSRRQELLVRLALGATSGRVVRQLLLETLLWAALGMVGGFAIASWFIQLFGAVGVTTPWPFDFEPRLDARVIATMSMALLIVVVVTAVGPSMIAVHRSKDLVPRRARATGSWRRQLTVGVQVALSIVLLTITAGLLFGFQRLVALAPTASEAMMAIEVSLPETGDDPEGLRHRAFFDQLLTALSARSEVQAVGAASYIPPTRPLGNVRFSIEGRETPSDAQTALASAVNASVFRLLGVSLVRGRLIVDSDGQHAPGVAVISSSLARRYWPDEDPIGRRLTLVGQERPITIVGIVGDVRQPISRNPRAESVLYLSHQQFPWPFMTIVVDSRTDSAAAVTAVRQEVARISPGQAVGQVQRLDELRTEWLGQPRLQATVVTVFGIAALLLTLIGLYARVTREVAIRAREFAIRQAIGARPSDIVAAMTRDAALVVIGGGLVGLALLPPCVSALQSLLVEAPPFSLWLGLSVTGLVTMAGLASAYWPARQAGRADPAQRLRAE